MAQASILQIKPQSRKKRFLSMVTALKAERQTIEAHWRDLAGFILPRRAQFTITEGKNQNRVNQKIIDNTGTLASRTLRAGMMSGVTSPSRDWFNLSTPDPKLAEDGAVKEWLHLVTTRMRTVFIKSNLYNVLPTLYGDLGTFATGCIFVEEDMDNVMHFYSFPIGTYSIALDGKGKVAVFARNFSLTIRQLLDKFGKRNEEGEVTDVSNFSVQVQNQLREGHFDKTVEVTHIVQKNSQYKKNGLTSKQYESVYYETATAGEKSTEVYLRDSGYDYFPILAPRWEVAGEQVYGSESPGMVALGDIKALQTMWKRRAQKDEREVNPPMKGPATMINGGASILPGDMNFVDETTGSKFEPVFQVKPGSSQGVDTNIDAHQIRIKRAFFEDLFLMMAFSDRRQITAREIDERHQEKLLALGPVLEQLNQDLLDPLIDIAFIIMTRMGIIPPAPEILEGKDLKVEYVSIMHQAQKFAGLAAIERFAGFMMDIKDIKPEALDKWNIDKAVDDYGDITGLPPGHIFSEDEVTAFREAKAAAVQKAQEIEQQNMASQTAKNLSGASLEGDNALTRMEELSEVGQVA